ncbi:hypothetical protein PAHAL_9G555900 [Panicum hallii]|uniref:Uncharacterized protein n=1 Tax=Panicum hallii TaxID=206008 RepID=A0A2S3ISZ0_9POAL|nr:hypothetical protein PAHAL_9G555900 [Panicum hallii]PAN50905.1 hypothetical protein PAHAL_9G555900 [Panicum hallii]
MGSFERRASSGFRPELRGGDNDVLQLACGFLWVLASAMRGAFGHHRAQTGCVQHSYPHLLSPPMKTSSVIAQAS